MTMKRFANWAGRVLLTMGIALGVMAGTAHAAQKVLILSTNEVGDGAIANVAAEFTQPGPPAIAPTHLKILGTAGAVTPATFISADGSPYDLVVVMSVYNPIDAGNMSAITTAINTRAANMFAMFIDGCQICSNNAGLWVPELSKVTAVNMSAGAQYLAFFNSNLNTNSPYAASFAGLNPLAAGYVTYIDNVPAANVLYLPAGVTPSASGTTAFGVFFPATQTGGAANMGGGACLFGAVDATLMAQSYPSNQGKFSTAILKAAATPDCAFPSLTKAFSPASVPLGGTSTLTITLSNPRSEIVRGVTVTDVLPSPLTVGGVASTTCTGGALSAPVGGNTIGLTGAQIPAAVNAVPSTCTITVPVVWTNGPAGSAACSATAAPTNPVTNTITPPGQFTTTAGQMGTVASATLACNAQPPVVPQVRVQKTTTSTTVVPGGTIVYDVVVTNTGAAPANGTLVSDLVPAGLTAMQWTCIANGGTCPAAGGSGALNQTIADFPAGAVLTYQVTATVDANPPAVLVNTANVTPGNGGVCAPGGAPAPCSSSASVPPVPQINIQKTTTSTALVPGGNIVYSLVVSNTGSVPADGTSISDVVPAGIASMGWTCSAAAGAVCPGTSGSGALNQTIATLPVGGVLTYTVTATVSATPPAVVTNTASVTPAAQGVCTPGNTPAPCTSSASVPPVPQISVNKSAASAMFVPGGNIVYTVTVANVGAVAANGTVVNDPLPAGISAMEWTCAASGATCPAASGSGALNQTIANFPAGSVVTYTLKATVSPAAGGVVTNTASVTPGSGGVCVPGNAAAPCTATVQVSQSVTAIPTLGEWALALLGMAVAGLGMRRQRRPRHA